MPCVPPAVNPEFTESFGDEQESYQNYAYQPAMQGYVQQPSYDEYFIQQQSNTAYQPEPRLEPTHSNDFPAPAQQNTSFMQAATTASFHAPITKPTGSSSEHVLPRQVIAKSASQTKSCSPSSGGCLLSDVPESELANQMGDLKISGVGHGKYPMQ